MPNYVISSTHASSFVLLDGGNPLSSSLLVLFKGFIKENTNSTTCAFWDVTNSKIMTIAMICSFQDVVPIS